MAETRRSPAIRLTTIDRSVSRAAVNSVPTGRKAAWFGPTRRDALRRWEEADAWSCTYCHAGFGPDVAAEVDHVHPLAKGGRDDWDNLTPACSECNRSKGDRDVAAWLGEWQ
ncbi:MULTISPECIES: HNH endonuclease signature motif containing protein [unclassified Streptomyces]|uniref:HNH endonuclease n=1 Tax=unclassified Streptomyces TaxID=2593676 RepID=UPI00340A7E78